MKNTLFIGLFFAIIISCGRNNKTTTDTTDKFKDALTEKFNISLDRYKGVVLIPASGCNECINEADALLQQEYKKEESNYLFLVTGYSYSKTARIRLGQESIGKKYILLDTASDFNSFVQNGKPMVYLLNNQSLVEGKIEYINSIYTIN